MATSTVKGHQRIAAAGMASAAALTLPTGADMARLQADTANVRYTLDGTTPTATNGMIIIAGAHQPLEISLAAGLGAMKVIRESDTANLNITYYGSQS